MARYRINGRYVVNAPNGFTHTINTKAHRGMAYEYIVVASETLGRDIKAVEVVHHRNGNKDDNSPENLLVLDSNSTHTALHKCACDESILKRLPDGAYTLDAVRTDQRLPRCVDCDKLLAKYSKGMRCPECASKHRCRVDWDNIDLKALLDSGLSLVAIGKRLGVSDNAVKHHAKKLGLCSRFSKHSRVAQE